MQCSVVAMFYERLFLGFQSRAAMAFVRYFNLSVNSFPESKQVKVVKMIFARIFARSTDRL